MLRKTEDEDLRPAPEERRREGAPRGEDDEGPGLAANARIIWGAAGVGLQASGAP